MNGTIVHAGLIFIVLIAVLIAFKANFSTAKDM